MIQIKRLWQRIRQTACLMVGVGDYENYCKHMHHHHPEAIVMNETEYFRYGQEARYPSGKNRGIKRCPC